MRSGRLRVQAKLTRFSGYFVIVVALTFALQGPVPVIHHIYEANLHWPVTSAVVKKLTLQSRVDMNRRRRGFHPTVYWMEFSVALDLSIAQCPAAMRVGSSGVDQCIGVYTTLETESHDDALRWGLRHRILSAVQVHYDPAGSFGNRVFFIGESIKNTYPWNEIAEMNGIFAFAALLFVLAGRTNAKASKWEVLERN